MGFAFALEPQGGENSMPRQMTCSRSERLHDAQFAAVGANAALHYSRAATTLPAAARSHVSSRRCNQCCRHSRSSLVICPCSTQCLHAEFGALSFRQMKACV